MDFTPLGVAAGILAVGVVCLAVMRAPRPLARRRCCRHSLFYLAMWVCGVVAANGFLVVIYGDTLPVWNRAVLGYLSIFLVAIIGVFYWISEQSDSNCEPVNADDVTEIRQNSIVSVGETPV